MVVSDQRDRIFSFLGDGTGRNGTGMGRGINFILFEGFGSVYFVEMVLIELPASTFWFVTGS